MSFIKAELGGKGKGPADQVTIDPAIGCKNKCLGCYGKKSSQRGRKYNVIQSKEFHEETLRKSIQSIKSKGYNIARIGKHCDPGDHCHSLYNILNSCNNEQFRCVVVSKSLLFNEEIAEKLSEGNHVLHLSFGPKSDIAPREEEILGTAKEYQEFGVYTCIRLTRDVTRRPLDIDTMAHKMFPCILTPMRYASKELLEKDNASLEDFTFLNGYYRPKFKLSWWKEYKNICGEIDGVNYCCGCLTSKEEK